MVGLILDYNGPIVEARNFYEERGRRLAGILGIEWTGRFQQRWKEEYIKVTSGQIPLDEYYKRVIGHAGKADTLDGRIEEIDRRFIEGERLIDPNIPQHLSQLRDQFGYQLKMCMLSNYVKSWVEKQLEMFGVRRFFDAIVVSDEIRVRKPALEAYKKGVKALGLEPQKCIYVGDTIVDLQATERVGMTGIFIKGEENEPQGYISIENLLGTKMFLHLLIYKQ